MYIFFLINKVLNKLNKLNYIKFNKFNNLNQNKNRTCKIRIKF